MKATELRLALVIWLAGCGDLTEAPRLERELGVIEYHDTPMVINVPDTVSVGVPFTVTVLTYGLCIGEAWDTEVSVSGSNGAITPYNYVRQGEGIACPTLLSRIEHVAKFHFGQRGRAVITIRGRRQSGATPPGSAMQDVLISVEREVVVR